MTEKKRSEKQTKEATKWGRKMPWVDLRAWDFVEGIRRVGDFVKRWDCLWNAPRWLTLRLLGEA